MTDIAKRPECWAFAMDFLGEPESVEVDAYACALEAEVGLLRANLASIQGHYLDLCRENRPSVALHEAALAEKDREIERLRQCLRHQDDRIGTHSAECYKFGHRHYECALQEIENLRGRIEGGAESWNALQRTLAEVERLRKERDDYRMAAEAEAKLGDEARDECKALHSAIAATLAENGHLADGDDCTLRHLVRAMAAQTKDSEPQAPA